MRRHETEDEAHDRSVVERMDDHVEARDVEAKRNAAGISMETLSMQEAFFEGQRAGTRFDTASLNPYDHETPEHAEWERGRSGVIGAALNSPRRKTA